MPLVGIAQEDNGWHRPKPDILGRICVYQSPLEKSWKDSVVHTPHYGDYGSIPSPQVVRRRSANHAYIFCSDLGDFQKNIDLEIGTRRRLLAG
jgi:hypothetical protein